MGLSTTQSVRWLSYAIKPTDYDCRLRSGRDVFVPTKQKVSSSADVNGQGVEVSVDVVFEPVEVGEFRDELIVSSAVGGEYIFPLSGHCIDPQVGVILLSCTYIFLMMSSTMIYFCLSCVHHEFFLPLLLLFFSL